MAAKRPDFPARVELNGALSNPVVKDEAPLAGLDVLRAELLGHMPEGSSARLVKGLSSGPLPKDIESLAAKRDRILTAVIEAIQGN